MTFAMTAPELHHCFWHVQRLLFIAMTKKSPQNCPMHKVSNMMRLFVHLLTDFLCTPPYVVVHPLATEACRVCFTIVCEACQEAREEVCECGCGDWRNLRGQPGRTMLCHYIQELCCPKCRAPLQHKMARSCFECGQGFLS